MVVEDDPSVADGIVDGLSAVGIETMLVSRGRDCLAELPGFQPDLIVLDLGLPDMDGTDVCREVRRSSAVPIIIVSARDDEIDRIVTLEIGADDYLVKPFGMRELVARIRAVTRRTGTDSIRTVGGDAAGAPGEAGAAGAAGTASDSPGGTTAPRPGTASAPEPPESSGPITERRFGALVIDIRSQRVQLAGEIVHLTPKEFDLVVYLSRDPGAVFRRSEILRDVWQTNWYGTTKTLDAHIAAIRRKLGDPRWIESVRGVGFRFGEPA